MWKTHLSPLFAMLVNPWGATKRNNLLADVYAEETRGEILCARRRSRGQRGCGILRAAQPAEFGGMGKVLANFVCLIFRSQIGICEGCFDGLRERKPLLQGG
jgi:hypothetical protein